MAKLLDQLEKAGMVKAAAPPRVRPPPVPSRVPSSARTAPPTMPGGRKMPKPLAERLYDAGGKMNPKAKTELQKLYPNDSAAQSKVIMQAQQLQRAKARRAAKAKVDSVKRRFKANIERKKRNLTTSVGQARAALQTLLTRPHHSPLARKGFKVAIGLGVLSKLLSSQDAQASDPEMTQVATAVNSSTPNVSIANNVIKNIQTVTGMLGEGEQSEKIRTILGSLSSAFAPLSQPLAIDNPSAVSSFASAVQSAELAVANFFEKSDAIGQILGNPPEFQELLASLGNFLFEVSDMRSQTLTPVTAGKVDKILKYANQYNSLVKEAIEPVTITLLTMAVYTTSAAMTMAAQKAVKMNEVKSKLQEMKALLEDQRSEEAFGKYQQKFDEYLQNINIVIDNIDKMLQRPAHNQDMSQVDAMKKFVAAAEHLLYKSSGISAALTDMQSIWGDIGGMLGATGLTFGWQASDLDKFNTLINNISQGLSTLKDDIQSGLAQIEAKAQQYAAQQQAVQTPAGQPGSSAAEQIANITL